MNEVKCPKCGEIEVYEVVQRLVKIAVDEDGVEVHESPGQPLLSDLLDEKHVHYECSRCGHEWL